MNEFLESLKKHITNTPFRKMAGFEVLHLSDGKLDAEMDLLEIFQRHDGLAHGGFLAYFADSLMGLSALSTIDYNTHTIFTAEMKVSYMRPGVGPKLFGKGRVIKKGKTITFCEAEIFSLKENGEEYLVCKASGTMCAVKKQK